VLAGTATTALLVLLPPDAVPRPAPADLWFRVLVAIPVGTALCEELIFRGIVPATVDRLTRATVATLVLAT
jgi:membrane protease YdiL (CAAX protease family)